MEQRERRRRIDRVSAPDYLEGLSDRPVEEVRAMREDCREEEARLSYARRLLQGQLDIVRAERRRRSGDAQGGLVSALSEILADQRPASTRAPRSVAVYTPPEGTYGARDHDAAVDDPMTSRVPDLDDTELAALEERLVAREAAVSALRRTVLNHLDALSEELVARYRDGRADVDSVVAGVVGTTEDPDTG